jgi:hypothetical protein
MLYEPDPWTGLLRISPETKEEERILKEMGEKINSLYGRGCSLRPFSELQEMDKKGEVHFKRLEFFVSLPERKNQ